MTSNQPSLELAWMWRLRWAVISAQLSALLLATVLFKSSLPLLPLGCLVALQAGSNGLLPRVGGGAAPSAHSQQRALLAAALFIDVCCFSVLLSFSGGAGNPFSAFYVVYVAMAALVLGADWALSLVVLTSLSYAAQFWLPLARRGLSEWNEASLKHLQCMWLAYVLAASFVAYFVSRVAHALREREAHLRHLERYAAAMERVASLSTLAADAAHELGTPLSAIAVSAGELARALATEPRFAAMAEEAREIRGEVDRCRNIIDQMVARSGQPAAEAPARFSSEELCQDVLSELGSNAERVRVDTAAGLLKLLQPRRALTQVVVNLVRNALDASAAAGSHEHVLLRTAIEGERLLVSVEDAGSGIAPEHAARLGEPFFTTKPAGRGLGLGLYLARTFARQVGGQLAFHNRACGGAVFRLELPIDCFASGRRSAPELLVAPQVAG